MWTWLVTICITPWIPCCLLNSNHTTQRSDQTMWKHCHILECLFSNTPPSCRTTCFKYLKHNYKCTTGNAVRASAKLLHPAPRYRAFLCKRQIMVLHAGPPILPLTNPDAVPPPKPAPRSWKPSSMRLCGTSSQEPLKLHWQRVDRPRVTSPSLALPWQVIYWCLSGMNRSKAARWQAINQPSNQGWQQAKETFSSPHIPN